MFNFGPKPKSDLEKAITSVFREMEDENSGSKEYARKTKQLTKLYALKETDAPDRISRDTLAIVLGNLAGIVFIVGYERSHVVTSRALQFVIKART